MKVGTDNQPIGKVVWIDRSKLKANDYNPNRQFGPEHELLKRSIIEDGWTQPIVVHAGTRVIIDGEHRWKASDDPRIREMTGSLVPVVFAEASRSHAQFSTIRHNRARGQHGVRPMGDIVVELIKAGKSVKDIKIQLGMETEEIARLAESRGLPVLIGTDRELAKARIPKKWTPYSKRKSVITAKVKKTKAEP
jgi:ParB-like chromosome segregation protein Spo0J